MVHELAYKLSYSLTTDTVLSNGKGLASLIMSAGDVPLKLKLVIARLLYSKIETKSGRNQVVRRGGGVGSGGS